VRRIIIKVEARRDLAEAYHYIAFENVTAADRLVARIKDAIELLAQWPGLGHQRAEVKIKSFRFWSVRPYVIVYRYSRNVLTVVRVLHGARISGAS
jgi:toxin ParE1/3/4